MKASRVCPSPGCGRRIPFDRHACPTDWRRLPGDLKREVSIAYGRFQTLAERAAPVDELDAARDRHEAAKAAADAWFKANP